MALAGHEELNRWGKDEAGRESEHTGSDERDGDDRSVHTGHVEGMDGGFRGRAEAIANTTGAFVRYYNNAVGFWDLAGTRSASVGSAADSDFKLGDALNSVPEEYQDHYLWCRSAADIEAQTLKLEREATDREIIASTGFFESLIPGAIAFMTDPTNIASAEAATLAASAIPHPVGKAVAWAGVFGLSNASMRYASKDLMTLTDVAIETIANSAIVGAFRGVGYSISEKLKKSLVTELSEHLSGTGQSYEYVGRDKIRMLDKNTNAIIDLPDWFQFLYKQTPVGKAATSEFNTINKMGEMWFRVDYPTNATDTGVSRGSSVESLVEYFRGSKLDFSRGIASDLKAYEKANKGNVDTFTEELRLAVFNGGRHFEPEIERAAKSIRQRFDYLNGEAHKVGLSNVEDPSAPVKQGVYEKNKFVESPYLTKSEAEVLSKDLVGNLKLNKIDSDEIYYLPRVWDVQKCLGNRERLLDLLCKADIKRQYSEKGTMSVAAAKKKAEKQFDHIIGASFGEKTYIEGVTTLDKYNKSRSVLIDDEVLSPFLVTNPIEIVQQYERKVVPAIMTKRVLQENGYNSIKGLSAELLNEYHAKLSEPGVDAVKLQKSFEEAKRLVSDIPALVEGSYNMESVRNNPNASATLYAMKNYNFARHMGLLLFSSLDNPANIVHKFGFTKTCGAFLREMTYSIGETCGKSKISAATRRDLNSMGMAIELETMGLADDLDRAGSNALNYRLMPKFEKAAKATKWLAAETSRWSGSAAWEDFNKRVAGRLFMDKVLRVASKGVDKLNLADRRFLAESRIPIKMVDSLKEQFELHGGTHNGLHIPNFYRWTDEAVKDAFGAATVTNSNNTIILPGVGDVPASFKSLPGRFLVSYYSYMFAYTNNILRDFATGRAKHKVATITTTVGLTALGKYLKGYASGNAYGGADDPQLWEDTVKSLPIVTWAADIGFTAWDIGKGFHDRGYSGGVSAASRKIPMLAAPFELGSSVFDLSKHCGDEYGNPLSERKMKNVAGLLPLLGLPLVGWIVNSGVRGYAEFNGAKLMKTRKERYLESK